MKYEDIKVGRKYLIDAIVNHKDNGYSYEIEEVVTGKCTGKDSRTEQVVMAFWFGSRLVFPKFVISQVPRKWWKLW